MAARFDSGMFFFLFFSFSPSSILPFSLSSLSHFLTESKLWKRLEQVYVRGTILPCLRACVRECARSFVCPCVGSSSFSCCSFISCAYAHVFVSFISCVRVFIRFFRVFIIFFVASVCSLVIFVFILFSSSSHVFVCSFVRAFVGRVHLFGLRETASAIYVNGRVPLPSCVQAVC